MEKLAASILAGSLSSLNLLSQSTEYKINKLISAYADIGQFNGVILVKKGGNIVYEIIKKLLIAIRDVLTCMIITQRIICPVRNMRKP